MVTADQKFYHALKPGPLGSSFVWVEGLPDHTSEKL